MQWKTRKAIVVRGARVQLVCVGHWMNTTAQGSAASAAGDRLVSSRTKRGGVRDGLGEGSTRSDLSLRAQRIASRLSLGFARDDIIGRGKPAPLPAWSPG